MLMSSFCAVCDSRSTTPASRRRLPNISMPTSGDAGGSSRITSSRTVNGKRMRSVADTGRSSSMATARSSSVVRARMIGGWMMGTSAMYE